MPGGSRAGGLPIGVELPNERVRSGEAHHGPKPGHELDGGQRRRAADRPSRAGGPRGRSVSSKVGRAPRLAIPSWISLDLDAHGVHAVGGRHFRASSSRTFAVGKPSSAAAGSALDPPERRIRSPQRELRYSEVRCLDCAPHATARDRLEPASTGPTTSTAKPSSDPSRRSTSTSPERSLPKPWS